MGWKVPGFASFSKLFITCHCVFYQINENFTLATLIVTLNSSDALIVFFFFFMVDSANGPILIPGSF